MQINSSAPDNPRVPGQAQGMPPPTHPECRLRTASRMTGFNWNRDLSKDGVSRLVHLSLRGVRHRRRLTAVSRSNLNPGLHTTIRKISLSLRNRLYFPFCYLSFRLGISLGFRVLNLEFI
jgi:hypothetical protein